MKNLDMSPSDEEAKTNTDTDAVDNQVGEENTEAQTIDGSEEESQKVDEDVLPKGIEKRFAKMTREKYEQQARIEALELKLSQANATREPELKREDFGSDEDAYFEYKAEQKFKQLQQEQNKAQYENQMKEQAQSNKQTQWKSKIDAFIDELPDYANVIRESIVEFTQDDVDAIQESPIGPKIAYALAKDDSLAEQFNSLSSTRARDRFLTKLEIKLESQPTAPKKAVSNAPAPTPKLGKGSKGGHFDPSTLSMEDWVKWRNGELK